ncbi:MAG TPA: DUF4164 family protein [Micropepsaceae bacterium]|jgi:chromosome segregation ATPase|nr:DUF4164 family protein [Micropepsaceae bacterium]
MKRLDAAVAHLNAALDKLEASADERLSRVKSDSSAAELALLKEERERLLARIAALEEETRTLAGLTEEVEDRLEGAIAEIRGVLARN